MKTIAVLICSLICFANLHAQSLKIDNQVSSITLDSFANRTSFTCSNSAQADTFLIENLALWIHAKSGGNDFLSIQNSFNHNDFSNGIYNSVAPKYSMVHRTSQLDIKNHQNKYNDQSYSAPDGIQLWPGSLDTQTIVSFVDANQNLRYEPNLGDYPFIRGDQCLLKLSNDNKNRSANYPALNLELAQYYFIFPRGGRPILDNTIGFRWVLKNNADRTYDSVNVGIQFHALLNQANSNYIGTDVLNNGMYVYESTSNTKRHTSILLLNDTLSNTIYYKNDGLPSNKNDIPTQDDHYINYLDSKWKDGDSLKLGSTGLDGDSSVRFVFPNTTLSGYSAWSEERVGNQGGDRNGLMISSFNNWEPGTYKVIEGAILFQDNIDSLPELYERHRMLKNTYGHGAFTHAPNLKPHSFLKTFPNPIKIGENLHITSKKQIKSVSFFNLQGSLIQEQLNINNTSFTYTIPPKCSGYYICKLEFENLESKLMKIQVLP